MYDITNRKSFDNVSKWLNLIYQTCGNKVKILAGNKVDLSDELRELKQDLIHKHMKEMRGESNV